ncbi:aminotransferase class I/II-fold pyridoxal phosphate-dependent enzyme [Thermosediminibacter oceani]|uniref:Aminotransferase n=1 Tax=Thermosediminibacter oceani (strain ATCC BAA-1034 / DSM 16646 / JW/IW-1228P) TaxID=555079 RepID=D9RY34_THEOJ|nr:aminotransferase class I/II-fold pyridoxal phosphate-dependent enzyme [Thermosediminibacter oceani]ADL08258.1 aromatic amino acid aminotransferase apoenzyme [Thermosediminibacter oceani DSM 16646]
MDYKKYVSEGVKKVRISTIRHFFNLVNQMPEAISLCIGEPDFVTPSHISGAAKRALDEGKTSYTPNPGLMELRREIADYLKRRFGLQYSPETEIIVTIGASEAIDVAIRTLLNPEDEVLIPEPSFVAYKPCTILAGGRPVFVPTYQEDEFTLKPDILERYITPRSKVLILNYPNNPTGAVMSRKQLEDIARIVEKHDLIVVTDEIYAELTYGVEHTAFATIPGMRERTVTINGFSKAYAMTGWRLGYIAAPEGLASEMLKVHQYSVTCAPTMGQYAAIEALRNGDADIELMRSEYDKRRIFLLNSLKNMGLECFEPKGAFYIFPSIKNTGLSSEEFAERLLKEKKVAVVPGSAFGETGQGFIRIAYATSMANLEEAVDRIDAFLKEIKYRP